MTQDQIKKIQDICWQRIEIMENASSYGMLPHYASDLYALYYLIMTRSFQRYVDSFGLELVDVEKIAMAKDYFKFPAISPFEKDVAHLLNQMVEGKARKDRPMQASNNPEPIILNNIYPIKTNATG